MRSFNLGKPVNPVPKGSLVHLASLIFNSEKTNELVRKEYPVLSLVQYNEAAATF